MQSPSLNFRETKPKRRGRLLQGGGESARRYGEAAGYQKRMRMCIYW